MQLSEDPVLGLANGLDVRHRKCATCDGTGVSLARQKDAEAGQPPAAEFKHDCRTYVITLCMAAFYTVCGSYSAQRVDAWS